MIKLTLSQLAQVAAGQLVGNDVSFEHISTDTRSVELGALFVALVGERFDAHQFAETAQTAGAGALLVERYLEQINLPQVVVTDTKVALGLLGKFVHQQCATATVAITGSCGKTTVKEMTASILRQQGSVLYTAGNFNNDIGVPLTLLRSQPTDDYAVIELGANHQHEIAYTTALVQPDIALVNNVAAAHLEGFGNLDGVKQAKGEIYQGLKAGGIAVVNLDSQGIDDSGVNLWHEQLVDKQVITFSMNSTNADYYASDIQLNEAGEAQFVLHDQFTAKSRQFIVKLGIIGQHNVTNALAAAIIGLQWGATIEQVQQGLAHLQRVKGRVEVEDLTATIKLIDDSYNASVPAMKAAIDLLGNFKGQRWLILGNMAELGTESLALHRQVGEYAIPYNLENVLTYGSDAKIISDLNQGIHFSTHQAMITYIQQQLEQQSSSAHVLLAKGANSAGMFHVVAALKELYS